jgi:glycerate kinase
MNPHPKILLALNSYKECCNAVDSCRLYADEFAGLGIETVQAPVTDGGDGFLDVCSRYSELEIREYFVTAPYSMEKRLCKIGYDRHNKIIYIETAEVIGLKLIPLSERNPLYASTRPLGELLEALNGDIAAGKLNADEIIVGIGGTGTSDLGLGMMAELGLRLYDINGKILDAVPANYLNVNKIEYSPKPFKCNIKVVVDVENPLLGTKGSNYMFAAQKGAGKEEIETLEKGFIHILGKLSTINNINVDNLNGAGGGLAAAFSIFFNAEEITANSFISDKLSRYVKVEKFEYILTGEGSFDKQSLLNKGAYLIIKIFGSAAKIFLCCGKIEPEAVSHLPGNVVPVELGKYFKNRQESIKNFNLSVKFACKEISEIIKLQ